MIRTVLAVVAGYAVIAAVVFLSDTAVEALGGGRQNVALVNLLVALPSGAMGGYVAAVLARGQAMAAAIALSAVAFAMGLLSLLLTTAGRQPVWYWCGILLLLPAGAYYGGFRRTRPTFKVTKRPNLPHA